MTNRLWLKGLTLIELVIALVIIGISSATISSLLVTSLNFAQANQSYASDLRDAEACYETLLAVHEESYWDGNNASQAIDSHCPSNGAADVNGSNLSNWIKTTPSYYSNLFTDGSEQDICVNENKQITCESLTINGADATKFLIEIRGKNKLELVVPRPGS